MSNRALTWAWAQDCQLPSVKLVLVALADHAKDSGECWPSITRIASMTGLSRATVFRCLEQLTGMGLIEQLPEAGKVNRYCLAMLDPSHGKTPITSDPSHGETGTRLMVRPHPSHGETDPSHGETRTIKNPKEPKGEPKRKLALDWEPDAALLEWAKEKAPHVDTAEQTERFIDYFGHIKTDRRTDQGWRASWRNWILRSRRDYRAPVTPFPSRSERTSQRNAALVRDALAARSENAQPDGNQSGAQLRLIEGGKASAD